MENLSNNRTNQPTILSEVQDVLSQNLEGGLNKVQQKVRDYSDKKLKEIYENINTRDIELLSTYEQILKVLAKSIHSVFEEGNKQNKFALEANKMTDPSLETNKWKAIATDVRTIILKGMQPYFPMSKKETQDVRGRVTKLSTDLIGITMEINTMMSTFKNTIDTWNIGINKTQQTLQAKGESIADPANKPLYAFYQRKQEEFKKEDADLKKKAEDIQTNLKALL